LDFDLIDFKGGRNYDEAHTSWLVAEGSASDGFLARSESGVAPGYDTGGWGALFSLGIFLFVMCVIFDCSFQAT
jgi:hypothetical protein